MHTLFIVTRGRALVAAMSYEIPSQEVINKYFQNCRGDLALPPKPTPADLKIDAVLQVVGDIPTVELPPKVELYHVSRERHWRWFEDKNAWSRAYQDKQKRCAHGFWFSMDPVASLGKTYRARDEPLAKFEVTSPLKLLDLTENVDERRGLWEGLVDIMKAEPQTVDPNAEWTPLTEHNGTVYGKSKAQERFGRLMGQEGRAYPDYYPWFWMALDLLELDGYVSYDPVDTRDHSFTGDVRDAMRRDLFPPVVHRAETAHDVFNFSQEGKPTSVRVSYAFPEFALGWRGVEKIRFVCDNLDDGCLPSTTRASRI